MSRHRDDEATIATCGKVAVTDDERALVRAAYDALAFAFDDDAESMTAWAAAKAALAPLCARAMGRVGELSIESATTPGRTYRLTRRYPAGWACECEAAKGNRPCWHVKAACAFDDGATIGDAIAAHKPVRKPLGPFAATMAGQVYVPPGSLTPKEREAPDAEPAAKTCFCCTGCGKSSGVRLNQATPGSDIYDKTTRALDAKGFATSHSRRWWCRECFREDYAGFRRIVRTVAHNMAPPPVDRVARGQSDEAAARAKWASMGVTEETLRR